MSETGGTFYEVQVEALTGLARRGVDTARSCCMLAALA
jgi:hypothetical protein